MSSVAIDVPPGTIQIVLKFQSEEAEQLRRRLRAAEDCNASLAAEVARLTREYMNARALIQQWEGSLTQTSQLPQNEVEDSSPLPICSAERPIHVIVKTMPLVSKPAKRVFVHNEAVWESPYEFGYVVKPTRIISKKGKWREIKDKKLKGSHNELFAIVSAMRCYLGTYERVSAVVMTKEEFDSLSRQVREAVIQASSHPNHRSETRRLYETGQILPRKINLRRVGFNHAFAQALLDAARARDGGSSAPVVLSTTEVHAENDDDTDDDP